MRRFLYAALAAPILALTTTALLPATAVAAEHYMWGVGPRIGTIGIPGAYPFALPPKIANYDMNGDGETDLNGNGDPIQTSILRSRWEAILGAEGVYYLDARNRVGAITGLTLGRRFWDLNIIAKYDRVLSPGKIDLIGGGGLGVGLMRFGGNIGEERLRVSYYPLRAHMMAQYRDGERAYHIAIAGQVNVPANHNYVSQEGVAVDVSAPFNYMQLNLEFAVMFGDFTPPKPKKRRGGARGGAGGGKGGGAKGGKGGGGKGGGGKGGGGGGGRGR